MPLSALLIRQNMCAVGVGAVVMLMKTDVRHSSAMVRRNLKQIRSWLEEAGEAAE
jgi:hypothetical protein